jgi:hypothetical protein
MSERAMSSSSKLATCPVHQVTADHTNKLAQIVKRRLNRSAR